MKKKIRIGTRRSDLALHQTELVKKAIEKKFPDIETEIVIKVTRGDKNVSAALSSFGGKGAFVEEFEDALCANEIDIAVHSAKDLPTSISESTSILGVLPRADPRDVLVSLRGVLRDENRVLSKFYGDSIFVGTSSPRRKMQIERLFSCKCTLLRGNVPMAILIAFSLQLQVLSGSSSKTKAICSTSILALTRLFRQADKELLRLKGERTTRR